MIRAASTSGPRRDRTLKWMALAVAIVIPFGFRCPGKRPSAGPTGEGGATTSTGEGGGTGGSGGIAGTGGEGGTGGFGPCVDTAPNVDDDFDGFTNEEGDCNDCDPLSNPQGVELPTFPNEIPADENCNGSVDEPPPICDSALSLVPNSAFDAASALDLCKLSAGQDDWGLIDARWTRADGTVVTDPGFSVGLSSQFGVNINPQLGNRMLVLSTGNARDVDDPNSCEAESCGSGFTGTTLPGFPQSVGGCDTGVMINDDIALEVELRAPSNVLGMRFEHIFATFEYPNFVCTPFNDHFLALVNPPVPGAVNGNVVFDALTTPPSSLFEIFDYCDPAQMQLYAAECMMGCPMAPMPYCMEGTNIFADTGFDIWPSSSGSGSTGWLETIVPVVPSSEFTVRFTVFDVGDANLDSTVWIDAVGWEAFANATPETFVLGNPN